jgi:hypothetical protein
VNVLVIFCSKSASTEQLALAAGVGAVRGRANLRIRRLPDGIEGIAELGTVLSRMQREYVPPTAADVKWADGVIIAMNERVAGLSIDPNDASAFGRKAAGDIRAFKNPAPGE